MAFFAEAFFADDFAAFLPVVFLADFDAAFLAADFEFTAALPSLSLLIDLISCSISSRPDDF